MGNSTYNAFPKSRLKHLASKFERELRVIIIDLGGSTLKYSISFCLVSILSLLLCYPFGLGAIMAQAGSGSVYCQEKLIGSFVYNCVERAPTPAKTGGVDFVADFSFNGNTGECWCDEIRWLQIVLEDKDSPKDASGKIISKRPYVDAPAGGYNYHKIDPDFSKLVDNEPFYLTDFTRCRDPNPGRGYKNAVYGNVDQRLFDGPSGIDQKVRFLSCIVCQYPGKKLGILGCVQWGFSTDGAGNPMKLETSTYESDGTSNEQVEEKDVIVTNLDGSTNEDEIECHINSALANSGFSDWKVEDEGDLDHHCINKYFTKSRSEGSYAYYTVKNDMFYPGFESSRSLEYQPPEGGDWRTVPRGATLPKNLRIRSCGTGKNELASPATVNPRNSRADFTDYLFINHGEYTLLESGECFEDEHCALSCPVVEAYPPITPGRDTMRMYLNYNENTGAALLVNPSVNTDPINMRDVLGPQELSSLEPGLAAVFDSSGLVFIEPEPKLLEILQIPELVTNVDEEIFGSLEIVDIAYPDYPFYLSVIDPVPSVNNPFVLTERGNFYWMPDKTGFFEFMLEIRNPIGLADTTSLFVEVLPADIDSLFLIGAEAAVLPLTEPTHHINLNYVLDSEISSITLPLIFESLTNSAFFEPTEISVAGTVLDNPLILDVRVEDFSVVDNVPPDTIIFSATNVAGMNLSSGSGLLLGVYGSVHQKEGFCSVKADIGSLEIISSTGDTLPGLFNQTSYLIYEPTNIKPNCIPLEETIFHIGKLNSWQLSAGDPEGDSVIFYQLHGPGFLSSEGTLSWGPDCGEEGNHTISYAVLDSFHSLRDELNTCILQIEVVREGSDSCFNSEYIFDIPPLIECELLNDTFTLGTDAIIPIPVDDADNLSHKYSLLDFSGPVTPVDLPVLDSISGIFSWGIPNAKNDLLGDWAVTISVQDPLGKADTCTFSLFVDMTSSMASHGHTDNRVLLKQNVPNPFDARTEFEFTLPYPGKVNMKIVDISGQTVDRLINNELLSGSHRIGWEDTDLAGFPLASGVYFCVLATDRQYVVQKIIKVR